MAKRRPTQADVARLADVSQSVVSTVVNGNTHLAIAPDTRQRVLAAIEELSYVPNRAARSLRTQQTLTIAGIIPDITNPFYPAFQWGVQDVAERHGYDLIIYDSHGLAAKERRCLRSLHQGRVDGVIASPFHLSPDDFLPLLELGLPVVVFGMLPGVPIDSVRIDNECAAAAAVRHLIERGHRRIGMIAGEAETPPRRERVLGYRRALAERGLPHDELLTRGGDFTETGGYQTMGDLLRLAPRPTAVFAANDLMAIGALRAIRDAGLRVPEDVALVGFDDIPAARLVSPPLTTVAQHPERLGRRVAELLFERIAGIAPAAVRDEVQPFDLVVRASS